MRPEENDSPSQSLPAVVARQIARRPYLLVSIFAHAVPLAFLYYFGSYQPGQLEQTEELASSLRATHMASAAERLRDLQTIKRLLEKSADGAGVLPEPEAGPTSEASPQSPAEVVQRARELSQAIAAIDEKIRAEELAELLGKPEPTAAAAEPAAPVPDPVTSSDAVAPESDKASVTAEMAADEVAELADKGRAILARREQRLAAKSDGIAIEGGVSGSGKAAGDPDPLAPSDGPTQSMARTEMAEFLQGGRGMGRKVYSEAYDGSIEDIAGDTPLQVPTPDPSNLVLGSGRILGAGGEYANRVFINSWYVIGPFPGRHGDLLFDNPVYPPENAVLLDAVYLGKNERRLRWRYVTRQSYPLFPPDPVEDGVYYGYTEVSVDEDCDLIAWIGADDDAQIYVNDRLVWRGGNVNKMQFFNAVFAPGATHTRDYNRSEGGRVVHFKKGRNKIFFKLSNGAQDVFLSMVLTR